MSILLKNGNVLIDGEFIKKNILIEEEKISKILGVNEIPNNVDNVIDCNDFYITPGLIDLHIHGGGGGFSQNVSNDQYEKIVKSQINFGTTSIVLTYIGVTDKELKDAVQVIDRVNNQNIGANIVGIHIEGPWIAPKKIGYLESKLFEFEGDVEHAERIIEICQDKLKIVTLAPEILNIESIIKKLVKKNIIVSCGHTEANYEIAKRGVDQGIRSFTHLWNMSGPIQSRDPGVVGCALSSDECFIELVADGYHVHPINIKNTIKCKPIDKVCLVTDAMIVTGTALKTYSFMGVDNIQVINGRTCGPNNAIIGSILTLDKAIKNVKSWTNLSLANIVRMASENPAKLIGIYPNKGIIKENADADIAIFDHNFNCCLTIVNGKVLYNNLYK